MNKFQMVLMIKFRLNFCRNSEKKITNKPNQSSKKLTNIFSKNFLKELTNNFQTHYILKNSQSNFKEFLQEYPNHHLNKLLTKFSNVLLKETITHPLWKEILSSIRKSKFWFEHSSSSLMIHHISYFVKIKKIKNKNCPVNTQSYMMLNRMQVKAIYAHFTRA